MKNGKKIKLSLWMLLFLIAIPLSALCISGQIEITQTTATTFPIEINHPGNYILTSDLKITATEKNLIYNCNGIQINADNVTLDLNGHTLTGYNQNGIGICASDRKNIKIKNGTIQNFLRGLSLSGRNLEALGINTLSNNFEGIKAESSIITNCTANDNGSHGIYAKCSSLNNCSASYNLSCGIYVESSTATKCKVDDNASHGIYAEGSLVEDCYLIKNKKYGLCLNHDSSGIKNRGHDNSNGNFYGNGLNHLPIKAKKTIECSLSDDDANYEF